MSLNDIRLPAAVMAALYPSSLVETGLAEGSAPLPGNFAPSKPVTETAAASPWKYLGDNQRNILIIVDHADLLHLPDEELTFLTSILTACKLSLGDVAIVNRSHHPQDYREHITYFRSRIILLFGVAPAAFNLPVDFPHFQVQSLAECTFLYSPPLSERHTDTLFKSKLWVCLKRIFSL